jgi:MPBQ/MSBQ methyltransferase
MNTTILISQDLREKILQYYVDAGMDYVFWSKGFNMHFGFGNLFSLFKRERMLNRMSEEVLKRLMISASAKSLADLGCGVGSTMRKAIELYPHVDVTGITLVPWQKEKAYKLHSGLSKNNQLKILVEDYHYTSIPSQSVDGVYAIESACYSPSSMHGIFFQEIYRMLRPGGKLVIGDGFLKNSAGDLNLRVEKIYKGICEKLGFARNDEP